MRTPEDAPRGPFQILELRHGLADIVERGAGVPVERPRVNPSFVQGNLASTYQLVGRLEDALRLKRVVYRGVLQRYGEDSLEANTETLNLALILRDTGNNPEAKELLRTRIPVAERSLGREHYIYFRLRWLYANSLVDAASTTTLDDLVQAEALLDDTYTRFRRVMGDGHPDTPQIHEYLLGIRGVLARARASSHA